MRNAGIIAEERSLGGASTTFTIRVNTALAGTSASNQFTIPTNLTGYNYDVTTSDGQSITGNTGNLTITFPTSGIYDINITGAFPTIYFANGGDKLKLLDIKSWGAIVWNTFVNSFWGCSNLIGTYSDAPIISVGMSFANIFNSCTLFNGNLSDWDVSLVNNLIASFQNSGITTQDLSTWNVSSVSSMISLFRGTAFNGNISTWNTSLVTSMQGMLRDADLFNQDISGWDINQVSNFGQFMQGSVGLSTANYDALLIAWDSQGAMAYSGTVDFGLSTYTLGGLAEASRTSLIAKWGAILDGGGI